jgi:isopentenyldiphosphate isomerase
MTEFHRGCKPEVCSVFVGGCTDAVKADPGEILDWRWVSPEALQSELAGGGGRNFTPWFRLEWSHIWRDYRPQIHGLKSELGS